MFRVSSTKVNNFVETLSTKKFMTFKHLNDIQHLT